MSSSKPMPAITIDWIQLASGRQCVCLVVNTFAVNLSQPHLAWSACQLDRQFMGIALRDDPTTSSVTATGHYWLSTITTIRLWPAQF